MAVEGGSSHTELALAMRESLLVGERVEGMCDGVRCKDRHLMCYNYRRRGEAPVVKIQQKFWLTKDKTDAIL